MGGLRPLIIQSNVQFSSGICSWCRSYFALGYLDCCFRRSNGHSVDSWLRLLRVTQVSRQPAGCQSLLCIYFCYLLWTWSIRLVSWLFFFAYTELTYRSVFSCATLVFHGVVSCRQHKYNQIGTNQEAEPIDIVPKHPQESTSYQGAAGYQSLP